MTHIPALIIGIIVTGYWARVMRLVYKTRRRTGHAANFAPPEPLGQILRLIWVPLVLVWIAHPWLVGILPIKYLPNLLRPIFESLILSCIAVALALAAMAGTLICWKKMGKSWRMGINPAEKTELIITGPYAYVRHPIYALSSLLMLATAAAVPSPLILAVAVVHIGLLHWEARREERYLLAQHGPAYADYLHHVARFLPCSLSAYQAQASKAPQSFS